jgi:hypothetical protein
MNIGIPTLIALLALASPVLAQNGLTDSQAQRPQRTVSDTLRRIADSSGITVLAESSLSEKSVEPLAQKATKDNIESVLNGLVKQLPRTVWAKVMLPKPEAGKRYNPDAVAQYVRAQASLFGKVGASEAGTVEIIGRRLPAADAEPVVQRLKLVPYYVLINTDSVASRISSALEGVPQLQFGGGKGGDMMGALLKQLGVASPDQIPSGTYTVQIPGPDGNPTNAKVSVRNEGGSLSIGVAIGGN